MKQVDGKYICNLNYMVYMGVLFVDVFINAFEPRPISVAICGIPNT